MPCPFPACPQWERAHVSGDSHQKVGGFGDLGILGSLLHLPAFGTALQRALVPLAFSPAHLFLVIDGLISSLCERKQISSNLQQ